MSTKEITASSSLHQINDGVTITEYEQANIKIKPKVIKQAKIEEKDDLVEQFDRMKLIKENLLLLSEIDKLKQTNGSLTQRIYYLESIKRSPVKKF